MIHTDGIPTIANHGSERLLEAKKASKKTASERIRAAREQADKNGGFDIEVENHGSIVLLKPRTTVGEEWLSEHVDPNAQRWGLSVVAEPRYVFDIVTGAEADGLNVSG